MEWDLRKRLKTTPDFVFTSSLSAEKIEDVPLNFRAPEDCLSGVGDFWTFWHKP